MPYERDPDADPPWETLLRLVAQTASGELVAASDIVEIRVYLVEGRLAWAVSSSGGNEFLRRLVEHHGISSAAVREVVEECRRTRTRLGDALIARADATADQVRDALRAQITDALLALLAHPSAHARFLPGRLDYAHDLTFGLDELGLAASEPAPAAGAELAQQRVATVLDRVPDALWIEAVEREAVSACAMRGLPRPAAGVRRLQRLLLDTDVEALVLRSPAHGAILGQRVPGTADALWCAVGADARLGAAAAVLADVAGVPPIAAPLTELGDAWQQVIDPGAPLVPSVFDGAVRTSGDLIAGFALGTRSGPTGVWRGERSLSEHADRARRLVPALEIATRDLFDATAAPPLYDPVALRAVSGDAYYGMAIPNRAFGVWLVLRRWTPQSLGWALLHALARQIDDL